MVAMPENQTKLNYVKIKIVSSPHQYTKKVLF